MPDFLKPQDLVPDQGTYRHVIEQHDEKEHQERGSPEDIERHDGLRRVVSFPEEEASE